MSKPIETFTITKEQHDTLNDQKSPLPPFYIINCLDEHVFIKTRDRAKAQGWVDEEYGSGKYRIRSSKL